jgi:hypothetical protein
MAHVGSDELSQLPIVKERTKTSYPIRFREDIAVVRDEWPLEFLNRRNTVSHIHDRMLTEEPRDYHSAIA